MPLAVRFWWLMVLYSSRLSARSALTPAALALGNLSCSSQTAVCVSWPPPGRVLLPAPRGYEPRLYLSPCNYIQTCLDASTPFPSSSGLDFGTIRTVSIPSTFLSTFYANRPRTALAIVQSVVQTPIYTLCSLFSPLFRSPSHLWPRITPLRLVSTSSGLGTTPCGQGTCLPCS